MRQLHKINYRLFFRDDPITPHILFEQRMRKTVVPEPSTAFPIVLIRYTSPVSASNNA